MKQLYPLTVLVAAAVMVAAVTMSGANDTNAEDKPATATAANRAAVEPTREIVRTPDHHNKQVALIVTDRCGHDEDGVAAGSAENETRLEADDDSRLTLAAARERAKVMHDIYAATLDVLHHRYFHGDRATVPARAMQDIFKEIERQSKTEARWISASMKPMSINHEPQGKFEKRAAHEIADGTDMVEVVEGGFYRRAGAIPLRDGCIGCHAGLFNARGKKPQFAGLVISVPIRSGDSVESSDGQVDP